jgi:hypothetical protein
MINQIQVTEAQPKFANQKQYDLFMKCLGAANARRDPEESNKFIERMEEVRVSRKSKFLSEEDYAKLKSLAPIACVDVLVAVTGPDGKMIGLLIPRRAEEGKAAEGQVWPFGGRTFYRENIGDTAKFNVFSESRGLQVELTSLVAVGRTEFEVREKGRDTINNTYLAVMVGGELKPSKYFSEYVLVDNGMFANEKHTREAFPDDPERYYFCDYVWGLLNASGAFTGRPTPGVAVVEHSERTNERDRVEALLAVGKRPE